MISIFLRVTSTLFFLLFRKLYTILLVVVLNFFSIIIVRTEYQTFNLNGGRTYYCRLVLVQNIPTIVLNAYSYRLLDHISFLRNTIKQNFLDRILLALCDRIINDMSFSTYQ